MDYRDLAFFALLFVVFLWCVFNTVISILLAKKMMIMQGAIGRLIGLISGDERDGDDLN